jgi:hypothetical protein
VAARLKLLEVADDAAVPSRTRGHSGEADPMRAGETIQQRAERQARAKLADMKRKERLASFAKFEREGVRISVERGRALAYEQSAATVARVKAMEDAARAKRELAAAAASARRKHEYVSRVDAEVAVQRALQQQVLSAIQGPGVLTGRGGVVCVRALVSCQRVPDVCSSASLAPLPLLLLPASMRHRQLAELEAERLAALQRLRYSQVWGEGKRVSVSLRSSACGTHRCV